MNFDTLARRDCRRLQGVLLSSPASCPGLMLAGHMQVLASTSMEE